MELSVITWIILSIKPPIEVNGLLYESASDIQPANEDQAFIIGFYSPLRSVTKKKARNLGKFLLNLL